MSDLWNKIGYLHAALKSVERAKCKAWKDERLESCHKLLNSIEEAARNELNTRPDLKAELVDEFNLRISKAEPYLKDQNVLHKADIRQIFREAINTIMGDTE